MLRYSELLESVLLKKFWRSERFDRFVLKRFIGRLILEKNEYRRIEGKSNVQYFGCVLSAASVRTGWLFLSQDRGKFDSLELLSTCCEAFTGALR